MHWLVWASSSDSCGPFFSGSSSWACLETRRPPASPASPNLSQRRKGQIRLSSSLLQNPGFIPPENPSIQNIFLNRLCRLDFWLITEQEMCRDITQRSAWRCNTADLPPAPLAPPADSGPLFPWRSHWVSGRAPYVWTGTRSGWPKSPRSGSLAPPAPHSETLSPAYRTAEKRRPFVRNRHSMKPRPLPFSFDLDSWW